MTTQQLLIFVLFVFFASCTFTDSAQSTDEKKETVAPPNAAPGKCYAKSLIPDQYQSFTDRPYAVYTGMIDAEGVELEEKTIVLKPATSKWVKKKGEKKCLSQDPNDCLIWCLEKIPAETIDILVLKDTTRSSDFEIQKFSGQELYKAGGHTDWVEVLCKNQVTKNIIQDLQTTLKQQGYYTSAMNKVFGTKTKAALTKFQKDNGLPVGNLDAETLDALGIAF